MTRTIQTARMAHASSGRPAIEVIDLTMEKPAKHPTTTKPPKKLVEPPTKKPGTKPGRKPANQQPTKQEMDSKVQTTLHGYACMRQHVARQELLDEVLDEAPGRRSKKSKPQASRQTSKRPNVQTTKKSKKKKHKRQHTRHEPASSTTTIIVHRYAFSPPTARQSKRPVGSGKLKLKRPMGTGKLKLKLKHKPTSKTNTTSPRAEHTNIIGVHRKTPTRKQPARVANTRLSTYNEHARTVRLCCKGTGGRESRIGAVAYQATIPELQCRSELVNDSQGLEQHCTDKSIYTIVAHAWKMKGSQQQLLVEKQAGLIGPYHSSILGTSDSDEEYGGTHWRTAATMRWAQHVEEREAQKLAEWVQFQSYLATRKENTPSWAPTWAMGKTRPTSCESPDRWIPHDR